MRTVDVIIIGAGAAGMMCAIEAGKRGRKVVLLDHGSKLGRKILISGGGRCNFTNINAGPDNFVSENPHFCKSALARYTPQDFMALVKKHRIAFHEKKLGQLFCDGSAQQVVDMLAAECAEAGAEIRLRCRVRSVTRDARFLLDTTDGAFSCQSLVVATGGLSVPQTGATGFGYDLASQFGLAIITPRPALDGFTLTSSQLHQLAELAGVSIEAIVSTGGASFRENILFTHKGLSGPASLQASLYWSPGQPLTMNLLPELDAFQWLSERKAEGSKALLKNVLSDLLPRRFAEKFCDLYFKPAPLNSLSEHTLRQVAGKLNRWSITPAGTVGFWKAEVTRGGVDTRELSSKSMGCKKVPGLFFIGEVVDVTGWLGGYNFQWAWASGHAAGQHV